MPANATRNNRRDKIAAIFLRIHEGTISCLFIHLTKTNNKSYSDKRLYHILKSKQEQVQIQLKVANVNTKCIEYVNILTTEKLL